MPGKATIDRATFDKLFSRTLDAVHQNEFGRIFKDVAGSRRGSRAVSVWARGTGVGLNEMSIDTGYAVERHGVMRFSQGEGCLELSIYFESESSSEGLIEVATKCGVDVAPEDMEKHVHAMAKALDLALRDKMPPSRLVPPPTVPYRLWAADAGDRPNQTVTRPADYAAIVLKLNNPSPSGRPTDLAYDVAELWSQLRGLTEQNKPG